MKLRPTLTILAIVAMGILLFVPKSAKAQEPVTLQSLDFDCLQTILRNCEVLTAGYVNVDSGEYEGAPMLAWQTQSGFTHDDGVLGGFVLFQFGDDGWELLDSGFDGARFQLPAANEDGLLHIPGYSGGTGAYNVDRLYQWGDTGGALYREAWHTIDMRSWLGDIGTMLPPGLEIWKGVDYDFENPWSGLVARTALWRADDGNCCPTGGSAVITFDIVDHALVATDIVYTPPVQAK
ncbi:hypothetical protein [Devosia sp. Root635]|uniref:hypothetical protein n=1 Tax=Devosia sp. Root635 TaxID=1736575 RepID=UPI0006F92EB9|nr:hypothetical protein [Devosia sp. Root635]KRA46194.1 hypothetical protein ASD80_18205 [Devosia sp. Root635]